MTSTSGATAYGQITQWYRTWEAREQTKPLQLLVRTGAPDEGADPLPTQPNDPYAQYDVQVGVSLYA